MRSAAREHTELRHYFAIKSDLAAAVRDAAPEEIDFHLNELATIGLHTTSGRLRRACRASVAGFIIPIAAVIA